jgi:hypothetical protein
VFNTIGKGLSMAVRTGALTLHFADGQSNVVFSAIPAGTLLPVAPLRVKAATTATLIVALY